MNRLFDLLPGLYRAADRDADDTPGPLETFLAVLDDLRETLEGDIATLYEAWFVETCEPWVLRYIGDLVGAPQFEGDLDTTRRIVANRIRRARRKGTPASIEGAAADASGWAVQVIEDRRQVITGVDVRHGLLRETAAQIGEPRVRLEEPGGAGPRSVGRRAPAHVVRIGQGRQLTGSAPEPGAGFRGATVHVRRLTARRLDRVEARRDPHAARWWIDPLRIERPLYTLPATRDQFFFRVEDKHVPRPLTCETLNAHLRAARTSRAQGAPSPAPPSWPGIRVEVQAGEGDWVEIPAAEIRATPWTRRHRGDPAVQVHVDPEAGCLWFGATAPAVDRVRTTHAVAGLPGAPIGGGRYDRRQALADPAPDRALIGPGEAYATLADAVAASPQRRTRDARALRIVDSHVHPLRSGQTITLHGPSLSIDSADGMRPTLVGRLRLARPHATAHAHVLLGGCLIDGEVVVDAGIDLIIRDCTIKADIHVRGGDDSARGRIVIERSIIVGGLKTAAGIERVELVDCIIDGDVDVERGTLAVERSTLFGQIQTQVLEASTSVFDDRVMVARTYDGYGRFSVFVERAAAHTLPRILYRCQPDHAIQQAPPSEASALRRRLRPHFLSRRFGDAAYAQLAWSTPREVRGGSMDGEEMGAWNRGGRRGRLRRLLDAVARHLPANDRSRLVFMDVPGRLESVMEDDR